MNTVVTVSLVHAGMVLSCLCCLLTGRCRFKLLRVQMQTVARCMQFVAHPAVNTSSRQVLKSLEKEEAPGLS
jgi:hypothetical protein